MLGDRFRQLRPGSLLLGVAADKLAFVILAVLGCLVNVMGMRRKE